MLNRLVVLSALALSLAQGLAACADPASLADPAQLAEAPAALGHVHGPERIFATPAAVRAAFAGPTRLAAPDGQPFQRVALQLDAADAETPPRLTWRARTDAGWTAPAPVALTFSEGALHVGRIALPAPTAEVLIEGAGALDALTVAFGAEPVDPRRPLTRDLPRAAPDLDPALDPHEAAEARGAAGLGTLRQGLVPEDLAVRREGWGARQPGRICNDVVAPFRASIHHTASPADDGADPAARLRQIQAFHMDGRGFCDIGYHFVVSQSGVIFEGRRGEDRPAAHVENENTGNVGICLIGNFEEQAVGDAQFAAAARILGWVLETHRGIPRDRQAVKGHGEHASASTACPGRNLRARLDALLALAVDGEVEPPPPPPPPPGDIDFSVRWAEAPTAAAEPGEVFEAIARLRNGTEGPLRAVRLGYQLPDAGLLAIGYGIYTDAPARDGQTFMINDADSAPENPPKDALRGSGELTLYALAAGETKEVRVTLVVPGGAPPGPVEARFWMANIADRYAQASFGERPSLNTVGRTLSGAARLTVFDPEDPEAPFDAGVGGEGGFGGDGGAGGGGAGGVGAGGAGGGGAGGVGAGGFGGGGRFDAGFDADGGTVDGDDGGTGCAQSGAQGSGGAPGGGVIGGLLVLAGLGRRRRGSRG